jgi:hypothetical protein
VRDCVIKIRVSKRLKTEWFEHANRNGVPVSDFVRTACRFSAIVGHDRVAGGLTDIAVIRRDLHAVSATLRQIANDNPHTNQDEVRSALASVHVATEVIAATINPGGHK